MSHYNLQEIFTSKISSQEENYFVLPCKKEKVFKFLSAEEKGESLHKLFNEFERQYCSVPHKPTMYFVMKKEYINRINVEQQQ